MVVFDLLLFLCYTFITYFQGVHPRLITEGFEFANFKTLQLLESFKKTPTIDRQLLIEVSFINPNFRFSGNTSTVYLLFCCVMFIFFMVADFKFLHLFFQTFAAF